MLRISRRRGDKCALRLGLGCKRHTQHYDCNGIRSAIVCPSELSPPLGGGRPSRLARDKVPTPWRDGSVQTPLPSATACKLGSVAACDHD